MSYDFEDEHLYAFFMDNKAWSKENSYFSPYYDGGQSADEVRLCDLYLNKNDQFLYLNDFGDEWRFNVTLSKILIEEVDYPTIIEVKGGSTFSILIGYF